MPSGFDNQWYDQMIHEETSIDASIDAATKARAIMTAGAFIAAALDEGLMGNNGIAKQLSDYVGSVRHGNAELVKEVKSLNEALSSIAVDVVPILQDLATLAERLVEKDNS